jgi:heavy metal translocating P-type ATPase
VVVYPGDMVPVDGVVRHGRAAVDQRSLTGESMPLELGPGDRAYAATVVVEGKLYMTCKAAGADTRAGVVTELVRTAPLAETRTQNHAAMLADRLVLPTFLLAGLTYAVTRDLVRVAGVLIVDFATGIRIALPTAVLASMQRAARRGILIKGGGAVERLASVDAVLLDKTGTLTHGEPQVTQVFSVNGCSPRQVLVLAAAAEQRLRHPTARAIVRHARRQGLDVPDRTGSSYTLGMGVRAQVDGLRVLVGSRRWLESEGVPLAPGEVADAAARRRRESNSYVAADGQLVGIITYADRLRPEAPETVAGLRRRGVRKIVMVTGDNQAVAWAAARTAGIDQVVAGAFPQRKAEIVRELKASGHTVAVVGDGINDSPAFAYADVAVSLRGGADVARERADVVLTDDDLGRLTEAIDLAREAMGLVHQGIATVVGANTAGLVLGTAGLVGPGGATVANNGSAVVAALQSLQPLLSDPAVPEAPPG